MNVGDNLPPSNDHVSHVRYGIEDSLVTSKDLKIAFFEFEKILEKKFNEMEKRFNKIDKKMVWMDLRMYLCLTIQGAMGYVLWHIFTHLK